MARDNSGAGRRVLIVGGVAGGASCAARLRRLDESIAIAVFERGPYVSFANCGLPYHVGNLIPDEAALLVATPELFRRRFNIEVFTGAEVVGVDPAARMIQVRDVSTGAITTEPYDALVLSPGAAPVRPPIPGIDLPGVFALRDIPDSRRIRAWIDERQAARAVVVGGGFIGLEITENLVHRGLEVTLVEKLGQLMPPLDPEMAVTIRTHLQSHGVGVRLADGLARIEAADKTLTVVTESGVRIPADLVVVALGVRPEISLARSAGLSIGSRGGIVVDQQMRTSDPHIWAVGDAVEVPDLVVGQEIVLPLAGPANRQGRVAAESIAGRATAFTGVLGTSVVGIMGLTVASTGASEKSLRRAGVADVEKIYLHAGHHAGYYPGAEPIRLKLLFSTRDGRIFGAQAVGREGVEKRIDVIASVMKCGGTVHDLAAAELCYAPQFGAAKDPVNLAGMLAENVLDGDMPLADWTAVAERGPVTLLDVREPQECAAGPVPGAINIPLSELRERYRELPPDREVWASCGVGQRAYYAVRFLAQHGYRARNLSGGYATYLDLRNAGALRA